MTKVVILDEYESDYHKSLSYICTNKHVDRPSYIQELSWFKGDNKLTQRTIAFEKKIEVRAIEEE